MLKAFLLEMKAMANTPTVGTRRKVWRTLYGGEPSPELLGAWAKNFEIDYAECRNLIDSGGIDTKLVRRLRGSWNGNTQGGSMRAWRKLHSTYWSRRMS